MRPLICDYCGSPAVALLPGTDDVTTELLGQKVVLKRGVSPSLWCMEHWPFLAKIRGQEGASAD